MNLGGRPKGYVVSPEIRAKISAAAKAQHARNRALKPPKKPRPILRAERKIAECKPMSAETKAKIRAAVLAWYADPVNQKSHRKATARGKEAMRANLATVPHWCVYCGIVAPRKDMLPDGPRKWCCVNQDACEKRIELQTAA